MALEPITRQEKIIAGQDLTPITRMEKFLKNFGGGGGGGGSVPKPLTYDYMPEGYPKKILTQKDLIEQQTMGFEYDPDFSASGTVVLGLDEPITGGKYKVTINDKTYESIAKLVTYQGVSFHVLGNGKAAGFEDTGESFGFFWYPQMVQIYIYENVSQAIVGISGDYYDVVPMVPEFVGGAFDSAVIPTGVETISWDGIIDGISDKFVWNGWNYYLVSNLIPSVSQLERSKVNDFEPYEVIQGTNACHIQGDCIVVYSRGTCSLPVHDGGIAQTFYAEKPGIYMFERRATIKLEIPIYLKVPQMNGIIIKSSNSEKFFKITVDDNGTLSATEVT